MEKDIVAAERADSGRADPGRAEHVDPERVAPEQTGMSVGEAARAIAEGAAAGAKVVAESAAAGARTIADGVATGAKAVADGVTGGAKRVHQAFGGEYGDVFVGNLVDDEGRFIVPEPLVDGREFAEMGEIAARYEKIVSPGMLEKARKAIESVAPERARELADKMSDAARDALGGLTKPELIAGAIEKAAEGFSELERRAAKASVSREYVVQRINAGKQAQKISDVSQICLLRAYDVAAITAAERSQHLGIALVEGGGTGVLGLWGLAANLALSMLIYFRAVQSVALFYGYDVKADPAELVIASEVFRRSLTPKAQSDGIEDYVGKVLAYAETATVKHTAKKDWATIVERGSAVLTLTQMQALASKVAQKAFGSGGQKAAEASVFKNALAQIGQSLALRNLGRLVPLVGAGFGALFDTTQMGKVLEFADLFYRKRFIVEKDARVRRLVGGAPDPAAESQKEAPVEHEC